MDGPNLECARHRVEDGWPGHVVGEGAQAVGTISEAAAIIAATTMLPWCLPRLPLLELP